MKANLAALIVSSLLSIAAVSLTQTPPGDNAPSAGYRPGLGDLMTTTVQPRHTKLGLAGRAQNWSYAAYELHELQEAFDRAFAVWPRWQSMPVGEMVKNVMSEPIAAVDQAIKAKSAERFTAAYRQLTEACDTCHQAADRAVIVIKVPEADMFPDQDFASPKR
jgi:hypothetical protein